MTDFSGQFRKVIFAALFKVTIHLLISTKYYAIYKYEKQSASVIIVLTALISL